MSRTVKARLTPVRSMQRWRPLNSHLDSTPAAVVPEHSSPVGYDRQRVQVLALLSAAVFGWLVGLRILRSLASSRVDWFLPPSAQSTA
jgi:hypothetical protein